MTLTVLLVQMIYFYWISTCLMMSEILWHLGNPSLKSEIENKFNPIGLRAADRDNDYIQQHLSEHTHYPEKVWHLPGHRQAEGQSLQSKWLRLRGWFTTSMLKISFMVFKIGLNVYSVAYLAIVACACLGKCVALRYENVSHY